MLLLFLLKDYDSLSKNADKLSNKLGFPLKTIVASLIILLILYLITFYTTILYKTIKRKYLKIKDRQCTRILILKDIKQQDRWHIINKEGNLNLTEKELEEYVAWLLKKGFIEVIGRAHPLQRLPNEPIYDITEKGNKFLNKHKNDL